MGAQDLQDEINAYGGAIPQTWGVPIEELQRGIRKSMAENPAGLYPRGYFKPAYAGMQKVCEERFEQFGTAGNAPKIKPVSLQSMAQFYL